MRGQLVDSPGYMMNYAVGAMVIAAIRARTVALTGAVRQRGSGMVSAGCAPRLYRFGMERPDQRGGEEFLGGPVTPGPLLADMRRDETVRAGIAARPRLHRACRSSLLLRGVAGGALAAGADGVALRGHGLTLVWRGLGDIGAELGLALLGVGHADSVWFAESSGRPRPTGPRCRWGRRYRSRGPRWCLRPLRRSRYRPATRRTPSRPRPLYLAIGAPLPAGECDRQQERKRRQFPYHV